MLTSDAQPLLHPLLHRGCRRALERGKWRYFTYRFLVPGGRFELPTPRFSAACSTPELPRHRETIVAGELLAVSCWLLAVSC